MLTAYHIGLRISEVFRYIDEIEKALNGNIDFEKINALIPKVYFVDRRNKFKITKKDLLEWVS